MPTYLQAIETDKLSLPSAPDDFYVVMKRKASYGDQLAAQSAIIQMDQAPTVPGKTQQAKADMGAYKRVLLARLIIEWNLSDEGGHPLPINVASVDRLGFEDGEFLYDEAQKRLGTRTPEAERDFETPSSGS